METGIITIGEEIAGGRVENTNLTTVSVLFSVYGHPVSATCAVKDDKTAIIAAIQHFKNIEGPVILSGGLGPTQDDITRFAVAEFLGNGGGYSRTAEQWLNDFLKRRNLQSRSGNRIQTWIPKGCRALKNSQGTACGFRFSAGKARFFAFPGVPAEFVHMVNVHVLPVLRGKAVQIEKLVWTWGWPESGQHTVFTGLHIPHSVHFTSLPGEGGLQIRASVQADPRKRRQVAQLRRTLDGFWCRFLASIPRHAIIQPLGRNLPESIVHHLKSLGAIVSIAESCSAGYLAFILTSVPGSSTVFKKGFITYSNEAKTSLLNVRQSTLKKFGAVSEQAVNEMVQGALLSAPADYACAVSGIAGPGGGKPNKPVGTVVIGAGSRHFVRVKKIELHGTRNGIRRRSAYAALNLLREVIQQDGPGKK